MKKEQYQLHVTLNDTGKTRVRNVRCKVYLPQKVTGPVVFYLYPTKAQAAKMDNLAEFILIGNIKNTGNEVTGQIYAQKVFSRGLSRKYWDSKIVECEMIADPMDLKITSLLKSEPSGGIQKTHIRYWLSECKLPIPLDWIESSDKGIVKRKSKHKFILKIRSGISLTFQRVFKYIDNEDTSTTVFTDIIADCKTDVDIEQVEGTVHEIDDLLMLASFAIRRRCVCVGWSAYNSSKAVEFYRRNVHIPKKIDNDRSLDELVELFDFKNFMNTAYKNFIESKSIDYLRQAILYTLPSDERTLESSFSILYAALETLVLRFRKNNNLEYVLPPDSVDWKEFQSEFKKWIKTEQNTIFNDKNKRSFVYNNLPALNRISFANAFEQMCIDYKVELNDLWPVADNSQGISLSGIRNKLLHGETFSLSEQNALMYANDHLQWIVERLILAVLGWPITHSRVSENFLAIHIRPHQVWKSKRDILS